VSAVLAGGVFLAVGAVGVMRYARNFWLYRGFSAPHDPAFVTAPGTEQKIAVASPALGGRSQEVYVYLPPGYAAHPDRRYPAFYLLHGVPGRPAAFLLTVRMGVVEDTLVAEHKARPLILVMPFGSTGTFTDKEWANGVGKSEGWETFVARDLVRTIDSRYRTVASLAGRALGGLSEGGYGALNIGLHHPGEFRVLESWLGYQRADDLPAIFGRRKALLAYNSPLDQLQGVAAALRRARTYVWFYSGSNDPLRRQNSAFAARLKRYGVPHRYFVATGGHNWIPIRAQAASAYEAAGARLGNG
jgi:enterochelin esterase-like enzyme